MRKIIQYIMTALPAIVFASCVNDTNEVSALTVKSKIQFVVDDFPMFEKPSARSIGNEDMGKTTWAVGDEIFVKLKSQELGTQTAILKYNGVEFEIQDGNSLCYLEGEPVTAYAYYAPSYEWRNGLLDLKDGEIEGAAEFIEAICTVHYGDNNFVEISFTNATRNYSRLRIATIPRTDVMVAVSDFTPANGSASINSTYTLTSDEKGNAYLYGIFDNSSIVTVKYGGAPLANYTFSKATENGKSYALDATVSSANSIDEIKFAIAQKIAEGKTTIRLNLASDAGEEEFKTICESLKDVTKGSINLILIGCEQIPANGLDNYDGEVDALKSISLPNVAKIGYKALSYCVYLEEIYAPNVTAIDEQAFEGCRNLRKVTFGELTDVKGDYNNMDGIFSGIYTVDMIDLELSEKQKILIKNTIENRHCWTPSKIAYKASDDHKNRFFLGMTFKSVKCGVRH